MRSDAPGQYAVRVSLVFKDGAAPQYFVSPEMRIEVRTNAPEADWPWKGADSARPGVGSHWLARARKWRELPGTPQLRTVEDAVSYVLKEDAVVNFKGDAFGFEPYEVTLPSGRKVGSGAVEGLITAAFVPFGKQAIPALIDLLDHDYQYARIGASLCIQLITGRKDARYNPGAPKAERQQSVQAWREWWLKNKTNPRLDFLPERVYDASAWDAAADSKPEAQTSTPQTISGHVVDDDGRPVAGAQVFLASVKGFYLMDREPETGFVGMH